LTFARVMSVQELPAAEELQECEYNGLDGIEVVRLGQRKGVLQMSGWLVCADNAALVTAKNAIRNLLDGVSGTLTNHDSESMQNVVARRARFFNRIKTGSGIEEDYEIMFEQLAP
jgi:hypothetical protein